ncbi:hypothetical protein STIAU_5873 [Stigmatella aurantiaca DW4/3-1]|uniref:Uncharacterized protein n=1 Tax=Stigmatella aurantiaca (strain DW4/3-1) TaxID=378806 RepID=Q08NR0_STIAD|nr:hypothetical protein STIAU_5873 [Stigmatella aurantiaca DW4/3-1]
MECFTGGESMFLRVQARAAALSAVQRLEEAQARAQLMSVVERLSWGPVDRRDVDSALERVAGSYAPGSRPVLLQDAMQALHALVAMRNGLSASLEVWNANRRKFEIGLRQALAFFTEPERKLLGSVAASLVHARAEPKGPVRTPMKGGVLPGSLKALGVLLEGMVRPRAEDAPKVVAAREAVGALKSALPLVAADWTGGSPQVAVAYVKAASSLIGAASGGRLSEEFGFAVDGMARLERVAALFGFPFQEIRLLDNLSKVIARRDLHGRRVNPKDWALALAGIPERAQGVAEGALLIDRFWAGDRRCVRGLFQPGALLAEARGEGGVLPDEDPGAERLLARAAQHGGNAALAAPGGQPSGDEGLAPESPAQRGQCPPGARWAAVPVLRQGGHSLHAHAGCAEELGEVPHAQAHGGGLAGAGFPPPGSPRPGPELHGAEPGHQGALVRRPLHRPGAAHLHGPIVRAVRRAPVRRIGAPPPEATEPAPPRRRPCRLPRRSARPSRTRRPPPCSSRCPW